MFVDHRLLTKSLTVKNFQLLIIHGIVVNMFWFCYLIIFFVFFFCNNRLAVIKYSKRNFIDFHLNTKYNISIFLFSDGLERGIHCDGVLINDKYILTGLFWIYWMCFGKIVDFILIHCSGTLCKFIKFSSIWINNQLSAIGRRCS